MTGNRFDEETQLGGYFVSAYPPFSFWTEEGTSVFRDRLGRPEKDGARDFGLYVHVPFCVERCQYCYYLSYDNRPGEVARYLEAVVRELELYAGRPRFVGRLPSFVYFGGGTPSLLSESRIRRFLGGIQRVFPWSATREVTFECAPRSVTTAKLEALRELGVTRINLGVQQLDDGVLERNGRVHLVEDVERAFERIRAVGFPVVNLDLIAGLVGETDETFDRSLDRVIEMGPESVTIYLLEIPHNTPLYRAIRDGSLKEPPADFAVKRGRLERGFSRLEAAGYTTRSAYSAVRDPRRHGFVYQDEQYRGADLLGIGVSSFSYLAGVHQQNLSSLGSYLEAMAEDRLPLWRAHELDAEERFVREVVLQLKLGRLDAGYFLARFGIDPREKYADRLERFRDNGLLTVTGDAIELTPAGLSRADSMVRELFLPRHSEVAGARSASGAACLPVIADPGA